MLGGWLRASFCISDHGTHCSRRQPGARESSQGLRQQEIFQPDFRVNCHPCLGLINHLRTECIGHLSSPAGQKHWMLHAFWGCPGRPRGAGMLRLPLQEGGYGLEEGGGDLEQLEHCSPGPAAPHPKRHNKNVADPAISLF